MSDSEEVSSSGGPFLRSDHTPSPVELLNIQTILDAFSDIRGYLVLYGRVLGVDITQAQAKIEKVFDMCEQNAVAPPSEETPKATPNRNPDREKIKMKLKIRCKIGICVYDNLQNSIGSRYRQRMLSARDAIEQLMVSLVRNNKKKMDLFKNIIERKVLNENCVDCFSEVSQIENKSSPSTQN